MDPDRPGAGARLDGLDEATFDGVVASTTVFGQVAREPHLPTNAVEQAIQRAALR